ncbi:uncharacterized protein LOC141586169 [Silene latifolia]|uniref:uncharacterized protein LOC141586169 n=1 Tax=Silene latifolia TaxID=37657 RepID=UPI003D77EB4C
MELNSNNSSQIRNTVIDILNSSDLDSVTEQHVRNLAADKLNLDLSDLPHKILIRQIIESFLLQHDPAVATDTALVPPEEEIDVKPVIADSCRVICKLSQKRDVSVRTSGGKTVVSIGESFFKDGKQILTPKWIGLSADQWSIFRKSIPDIEEAITKVESRLRRRDEKRQADADISENVPHSNGFRQATAEPMLKIGTRHRPGFMDGGKQVGNGSRVPSTSHRLVPIDLVRFDGKNYQQWVDHMESYLTHLKVRYVLSDPCPSAAEIADWELSETLSAIEKWRDDDHICRQNIINTLCDNLYSHYSKKRGSARDLWEELKVTYLYEEYGAKVSLVKKYIEFQIVEEKSVFEQVQELHHIADSLIASGMYVEEKLHVNVIISKLPPSWKPFSVELMKEDYLPVWMLMNELKDEEEYRQNGNKNEGLRPRLASPVFPPAKKLGPERIPMKRPGMHTAYPEIDRERVRFCNICKKKGHFPEQCWFRNSGCKDNTVETDSVISDNVVAEGVNDVAAGQSNS